MKTNPNDQANPTVEFINLNKDSNVYGLGEVQSFGGLTKREHFAAMALQGLMASPASTGSWGSFAHSAVIMADELIAELNKGEA